MDMTGSHRIAASRDVVWKALNDPDTLQKSIPGCEKITKLSDTEMDAVATVSLGPVKARFSGRVTLRDLDPPNSYTLSGEGQGGAAGFAKGEARVRLSPDGSGTLLSYEVKANIGGRLAQMGQRLIDGAAKKMADDFFTRFAALADDKTAPPPVEIRAGGIAPSSRAAKVGVPVLDPPIWIAVAVAVLSFLVIVATTIR
jgi:carbon monoxide dehydrogenase subunit G